MGGGRRGGRCGHRRREGRSQFRRWPGSSPGDQGHGGVSAPSLAQIQEGDRSPPQPIAADRLKTSTPVPREKWCASALCHAKGLGHTTYGVPNGSKKVTLCKASPSTTSALACRAGPLAAAISRRCPSHPPLQPIQQRGRRFAQDEVWRSPRWCGRRSRRRCGWRRHRAARDARRWSGRRPTHTRPRLGPVASELRRPGWWRWRWADHGRRSPPPATLWWAQATKEAGCAANG